MDRNTPRLTRSRPRLDYSWQFDFNRRRRMLERKVSIQIDGITYVRCGGGFRVLRRVMLPGDER